MIKFEQLSSFRLLSFFAKVKLIEKHKLLNRIVEIVVEFTSSVIEYFI